MTTRAQAAAAALSFLLAATPAAPIRSTAIAQPTVTDADMTDTRDADLRSAQGAPLLRAGRLAFADLPGWADDDHAAALATFRLSCRSILDSAPELRPGVPPTPGFVAICRDLFASPPQNAPQGAQSDARAFFEQRFTPWRIRNADASDAFFTGYYEPEVAASLTQAPGFETALRARPADLVSFPPDQPPPGAPAGLAAARRLADGTLGAMPTRAEIDAGALGQNDAAHAKPIAFVRDPIEAFMIQVQGSARLRLPDGRVVRAVYDGRNGHPYTSIGRVLVTDHGLTPQDVTLEKLKAWVRASGQKPGEPGLALLHRNKSFVFFRLDQDAPPDVGPIGAQGIRLTKLRSIAVDRAIWPYGTPVWIDALTPWESEAPTRLARLTIAQDTGSAILGPARADIFHGAGEEAGRIAGATRHQGAFVALLPNGETPPRDAK